MNAAKEKLLTTRQAGAYLKMSFRTLEGWRLEGRGPEFIRLEKRLVRYELNTLKAYAEASVDNSRRAQSAFR